MMKVFARHGLEELMTLYKVGEAMAGFSLFFFSFLSCKIGSCQQGSEASRVGSNNQSATFQN